MLPENGPMTATHPATNPEIVTVYGADWCGDCRRTKRLLDARAVPYTYVDVAAEPVIRDELTANGYPAIPVVVLRDGTILMEPSDAALAAAIDGVPGVAR
jgi:mycoredoxin